MIAKRCTLLFVMSFCLMSQNVKYGETLSFLNGVWIYL
ncbi:hypothetical protein BN193_06415 [Lactococcus raffinolactis 4877]|nr:hypothetical protein BN193_06415 [Lactococcus raffinolactis 4877]